MWGPDMAADFCAGPPVPPVQHPLWQGSISSKWMDRGSGMPRGIKKVGTDYRDGVDGPARLGLGGYMADAAGKLRSEAGQGKHCASTPALPTAEIDWLPGRRTCAPPTVKEPDRLTYRPPFVPRKGNCVLLPAAAPLPSTYDIEVDRFQQGFLRKQQSRREQAVVREERLAQRMVRELDSWEREHAAGLAGSPKNVTRTRRFAAPLTATASAAAMMLGSGGSRPGCPGSPAKLLLQRSNAARSLLASCAATIQAPKASTFGVEASEESLQALRQCAY